MNVFHVCEGDWTTEQGMNVFVREIGPQDRV